MIHGLDYIFFTYGAAFLLLAAICWGWRRDSTCRLPWRWLMWFGALHGANEWLDMLAISAGDNPAFAAVRLTLMSISFAALFEFGRAGLRASGGRAPGRWIYIPLLALAGLGALAGISGLNAACRYALGLPGGILSATALYRSRRGHEPTQRACLVTAAAAMLVYGVVAGAIVPAAPFFPASWLNHQTFLGKLGFPVQVLRMTCAAVIALAFAVLFTRRVSRAGSRYSIFRDALICGVLVAILVGGWFATNGRGEMIESQMRERLLAQACTIADAIGPNQVKSLTFTAADKDGAAYRQIRAQMTAYGKVVTNYCSGGSYLGIYSMAMRGGELYFGPENIDPADSRASPPGTVYHEPPPVLLQAFVTRRPVAHGPYTDEYGTFVSAFAPILDERTGEVVMMVGMDVMADHWQRQVADHRLIVIEFALVLILLLLGGAAILRRRESIPIDRAGWLRHAEAGLSALCGLLLTAGAVLVVHDVETGERRQVFSQIADAEAFRVRDSLHDIEDYHLGVLARFVEGSPAITRKEFKAFASALPHSGVIKAFEWMPRVPADQRAGFEGQARAECFPDFGIFQWGAKGARTPAAGRDEFYPIFFVEPQGENAVVLGFDIGSDIRRQLAMRTAAATGLTVATDPFALVQDPSHRNALMILKPVFATAPEGANAAARPLRGYAAAVMRAPALLRCGNAAVYTPVLQRLYQLDAGPEPLLVASNSGSAAEGAAPAVAAPANGALIHPVFAFGRTYAIVLRPGPDFHAASPEESALMVGASLSIVTLLISAFVEVICRRRVKLELLVQARTADLAVSRERFAQVAEQSREIIWEIDVNGMFTYVSRASFLLLGYQAAEVVGRMHIGDWRPAGERDEFRRELMEAFARRTPWVNRTGRVVARDGRVIDVLSNARPVVDAGGILLGYRGSDRDVTVQRQTQEALSQAKEAADAANKAKSRFLANMSHEIRTPLNGVVGMAALLGDTQLTDKQRQYVDIMNTSAESLLSLINDILDFSKIEAGRLELTNACFDLPGSVHRTIAMLEHHAAKKGLRLDCRIDNDVPQWVCGDADRVRQVLVNLVNNAIKFTSQGSVSVTVTRMACAPDAPASSRAVRFSVVDTGIGIAPDRVDRLFRPFSQVDATTTRKYGGTGLGLAISKQLAELMGGTIGVESSLGAGSTFWFTMVVEERPAPATETRESADESSAPSPATASPVVTPSASPASRRPARILVAEDNETNQIVIRELLRKLGHSCEIAANGRLAVEALQRQEYDLVLMDCQMPEMDGFEAARAVRQRETAAPADSRRHVPIVALTANAIKGDREACLAAGMDDYMTKPVSMSHLKRILELHLFQHPNTAVSPAVSSFTTPAAPASSAAAAPLNLDELFERCLGDIELIEQLVGVFRDSAGQHLRDVESAVEQKNADKLAKSAHALKGAAAIMAAGAVRDCAKRLEELGRARQIETAGEILAQLRIDLDQCLAFLPNVAPALARAKSQSTT